VLKWLCGGPGGAYIYATPEMSARYAPALTGRQAHARPCAFDDAMDYAPGAARWLSGTPAIPALYAAVAGPRLLRAAGIEQVRAKSTRQTARLIELADERGYRVHAPRDPARRGGTVAFDVPHGREVAQCLLARDIVIDYRPGAGIRVAPHFYTADDELDAAVAAIDEVLATGAWREYADRQTIVT
jgi:kynureninase